MGVTVLTTGCGGSHSASSNDDGLAAALSIQAAAGPSGYHNKYSSINHTYVQVKNFDIRTEEGQVIHINTNPVLVDLQDLSGFTKGLNLDLTNVDFPGGAQTINVAEIQVTVDTSYQGNITSTDGTTCNLSKVPKTLNLYTANAITLGHDVYHVKVNFTALNAIQLDEITLTDKHNCFVKAPLKASSHKHTELCRHEHDGEGCDGSVKRSCSIVNQRHSIPSIPRAIDDAF